METNRYVAIIAIFFLLAFSMPSHAGSWVKCSNENGYCQFSGSKQVRYGHGRKWHYKTFSNGVPCNNQVFGDPYPWQRKRCEYYKKSDYQWKYCASEGKKCKFSGRKQVRYGAHGKYRYKTLENGIYCTNDAFNGDPVPFTRKHCYVKEKK